MKFNMPMAVFGGLALIAAAIYFGSGSQPVNAAGGVQKIAICNHNGAICADIWNKVGNVGPNTWTNKGAMLGVVLPRN